jgi:hypothetical protein
MTNKPRLLIPLTGAFCVRYALRTGLLDRISEYAQPVILLGWHDPELEQELEQGGAEVHPLPKPHFSKRYSRIRNLFEVWHTARLASPSSAIDKRRNRVDWGLGLRSRRALHEAFAKIILCLPSSGRLLRAAEQKHLCEDTNLGSVTDWVRSLHVDAALSLTPFIKSEEMTIRACLTAGIPACAAILSFDNLTTRGWIPIVFDQYLLWNRYNETELRRGYPEAVGSPVSIVGPAQLDFYWDDSYIWNEPEWRARLNLPKNRPVLLFGGGPVSIVPHEPHWLTQLDGAIERAEIPGKPVILFRRHPLDPVERWKPAIAQAKHVVNDEPWRVGAVPQECNIKRADLERLVSTLKHSHVHINTSSTLTIDGAVFDRPQIGPAYDDRPGSPYDRIAYELYLREHYLPITNSGGLEVVRSRSALVAAICSALSDPNRLCEGRKRLVREICTYTDGKCTERVNAGIRSFMNSSHRVEAVLHC